MSIDGAVPLRRNRDFQLLWIGQAASSLGTQVTQVAFPLLMLWWSGSASEAGFVTFALTLPLFLFTLPAGALIDRWNRRRIMLTADAVRAVAMLSVVAAVMTDRISLAHITFAAFIVGTFAVFFDLSDTAALRFLVPAPQVGAAVAQVQARENAAWLLGGPLGTFLFSIARVLPFLVDALSYLVGLITTLLIRKQFQGERERPATGVLADIRHGLRWVWRQPYLRAVALLAAASNGVMQAMILIMIFVAQFGTDSYGLTGVMLALAGLGGLAGALAAGWVRRLLSDRLIVVGINWLWVPLLPAMIWISQPLILGGIAAVLAFGYPAWNAVTIARRLELVPENLLGRAQSVHRLLGASTIPLGALTSGVLYETFGVGISVLFFAFVMLVVAIAATFSRALRPEPRTGH